MSTHTVNTYAYTYIHVHRPQTVNLFFLDEYC